ISWIPRISLLAQSVDEPVTETTDDRMTEIGTGRISERQVSRRSTTPLPDPRRAPGAFAGSSQTGGAMDGPPVADLAFAQLPSTGIAAGVAAIRGALRTMPATPGVYRMLDRKGDALYVGKARSLKSRVQNYAHPAGLSNRLRRMISETATVEVVVT